MKTNQEENSLSFWYFIAVLLAFTLFYVIITACIGDFASFLSSIGQSHLMKNNH